MGSACGRGASFGYLGGAEAVYACNIQAGTYAGYFEGRAQVTGIRKEPWAAAHRIVVEEVKLPEERGTHPDPKEWGHPDEKGRNFPELQRQRKEMAWHQEAMAQHRAATAACRRWRRCTRGRTEVGAACPRSASGRSPAALGQPLPGEALHSQ